MATLLQSGSPSGVSTACQNQNVPPARGGNGPNIDEAVETIIKKLSSKIWTEVKKHPSISKKAIKIDSDGTAVNPVFSRKDQKEIDKFKAKALKKNLTYCSDIDTASMVMSAVLVDAESLMISIIGKNYREKAKNWNQIQTPLIDSLAKRVVAVMGIDERGPLIRKVLLGIRGGNSDYSKSKILVYSCFETIFNYKKDGYLH